MNEKLVGHSNSDYQSYFYISFFPCVNTTKNNNNCKSREDIDNYLKSTFVSLQIQDIEMTPQNYNSPVFARDNEIYTSIGNKVELYYNGKNKKTSFIRFIFTIIYIAIYLFLFIR